MIYTPPNLTTTAGTPKKLATTRTPANWVLVTALASNSGANVFVGGIDPTAKGTTTNVLASGNVGVQIAKGTTQLFPSVSAVSYIDLNTMWFDVATSNDGISITYGVR